MMGKILTFTAAAGLLIASSTIGFAETATAQLSGAKIQEKSPAKTKTAAVNAPGRVIQEDGARVGGGAFAASQGTTGMKDPTESYDRGPSIPSEKH